MSTCGLILHARGLAEGLCGFPQRLLGRALQRVAVLVKERAQQTQRGNLGKRVEEGGAEPGQHIQVARAGLDEAEQAGTVHALTTRQDGAQILLAADHKIQGFQLAVAAGVHEVDHADVVLLNEADDVGLGELFGLFLQVGHYLIGVKCQNFVFQFLIRC